MSAPVTLRFENGTLALLGAAKDDDRLPSMLAWDARAACHRAPAMAYAPTVLALRRAGIEYVDEARKYGEVAGALVHREPRPYQSEALAAWKKAQGRGVVVLPTGAGKTQVATMAIDDRKRSTLVVAPTLELVRQWYDVLRATFGVPVGVVGGGDHVVHPITVTTYDSAHLHMEHLGARFGLLVFDEVHHLPSASYALAAKLSLAPFRLGLTATPERADGLEAALDRLVGPVVYHRAIGELAGEYLAEYETERVEVDLTPEERAEHDAERKIYRDFVGMNHISMSSPRGFGEFVMRSARSAEGRRAMKAYRRQRELAFAATAKLVWLEHLLDQHRSDRTLIFTQDNATAHLIARRFLVPVITHQTKVTERSEILAAFAAGDYTAIATSKVLNEGVDVPEANVAVVLSGSGSVREHVQRLGRILRQREGKRALLYEVVTKQTTETFTSDRRREHDAYR
ncbi:MAG: DEAD/DEAH box helicase family protein [Labilithrix sp.]|nr:DEAD/DEAH box helicase family protein [Labilithrix sp.]MCW5811067.1 DEAD/DEAH box helicase family protein [Labilithrix sp.]